MDVSIPNLCFHLCRACPSGHTCFKHGSIVKELATLGANWKFYDGNFRKLRESQGVPRNQVHSTLWLSSHSFRAKLNTQPRKCKVDGPFIPKGYCWKFHRGLHYPGCSFKHQYFRCGRSHPIETCSQPKPQPGQRTKPSILPVRSTPNTSQSWEARLLFRRIQCTSLWGITFRFFAWFPFRFSWTTNWPSFH